MIEIVRLCSYLKPDWRCSYLRTKDGAEIDLIIDRPGLPHALIEIKSTINAGERDVATLNRFSNAFSSAELFCISRDPHEKKIGYVWCFPFKIALQKIGLS